MPNHHTPSHPELAKLADALLELENPGEAGHLLDAIHDVLAPAGWDELTAIMEVCPVHLCDEEICRDDQADCPAGRGEA